MIQTPRTVKYVVVDECVAGLAKRPFALRTLRIYTIQGDWLKTTVANPTHERKHTHGTNHSLTHSSTPRSCSEARGSGTTASGLCNPGEGGNTRDTSLEARTRSCGTLGTGNSDCRTASDSSKCGAATTQSSRQTRHCAPPSAAGTPLCTYPSSPPSPLSCRRSLEPDSPREAESVCSRTAGFVVGRSERRSPRS